MACFLWGIGILGGLCLLGWFLCFIDNEKTKSRRTYLESGSVGKSELRNRAKLFLKKQKVGRDQRGYLPEAPDIHDRYGRVASAL